MAMVFPGQGSQSVGMMSGYEGFPVIGDTFAEASALLGQDLWRLAAEGPEILVSKSSVAARPSRRPISVTRSSKNAAGMLGER